MFSPLFFGDGPLDVQNVCHYFNTYTKQENKIGKGYGGRGDKTSLFYDKMGQDFLGVQYIKIRIFRPRQKRLS